MNEHRIALLEQYIKDEPDNPFNRYALAMEFYNEAPDKAIELLQKLIHDHPSYLPSYYKAAHLLWEEENWDEAEQAFINGIEFAKQQQDYKALKELLAAYQNFQFEMEN